MQDAIKLGRHGSLENKNRIICSNGHKFTKENTYIRPNGNRTCRICNRLITAKRRAL